MAEPILDPDRAIIDPHHHLWDRRRIVPTLPAPAHPFEHVIRRAPHYMLDELVDDMTSGHNIRATVFLECGSMYRVDGPPEFRCVGETEFVNGIAAMSASGGYGEARACAAIVSHVDLTLGDRAGAVLEAHIAAAPQRFRGIRHSCSWDEDPAVLGPLQRRASGDLYATPAFRAGFKHLARLGLSFDAWLLEPQLPYLIDLARAFPDTRIVVDHVATPLGIAAYADKREERFVIWRENMKTLGALENVFVKLGGLAMPFAGFPSLLSTPPATSAQLAAEWRAYIEASIEAFTPARAMFESNFPVDALSCDYATLWNAFKRVAKGYSETEKQDLFYGAAANFYRITL